MMTTQRRKLTQPLGTVTAAFGSLLLWALVVGAIAAMSGSGSFMGFGHATICQTQPDAGYGGSGWTDHLGITVRPGAWTNINGALQACTAHPGTGQRVLYTLTTLPALLLWACMLYLLWRLIRTAARSGPFTVPVAAAMRRLGWLIIVGNAAAAVVQALAVDRLLSTMIVNPDEFGAWSTALKYVSVATGAVVPVPALAGAALLTFARIIRLGVEMDDEIKGTV
jgi:Protein of unknown function (DUF2975)